VAKTADVGTLGDPILAAGDLSAVDRSARRARGGGDWRALRQPPATRGGVSEPGRASLGPAVVVHLAGGPLAYTVRRSPRARRLRVTIDPLRGVIVSLPTHERRGWSRPEGAIHAFLVERETWIRGHLDRAERQRGLLALRGGLVDGGQLRFRGELHRLRMLPAADGARRTTVSREGGDLGDEVVVRIAARDRRELAAVIREWLVVRARMEIQREIGRHAAPLRVAPAGFSLRDQRTRWGSASRRGRLSFSWRLVLAPPEALETVVIHELAHLEVFGHGPAFWSLVASRRPDHARWRRWLREHALELHTALE
jgi:predicted metal-dependent hydrolase